ncbi:hypothetical protein FGO68_gene1674 [Halteria grandinella]|uniref:Tyrosine--tRNA ligase n=1 Tax=Halteria grandinella TaxID=5974 RepID=A0A8J8T274_HALGN|nr:hypothetical protein FGO68_gene1674 [Halteria grandinella]
MKQSLLSSYKQQPFKLLHSRKLLYYVSNPRLLSEPDISTILPPASKDGTPTSVYIGIDPTADSIHIGNYVSFLVLNHLRLAGYSPILIFGGATGLIGDPSGRKTERKQMLDEQIQHNINSFQQQFTYLIDNLDTHLHSTFPLEHKLHPIRFVNNIDFYRDMNVISFLRDVGVHFRLNSMLSRDSVKQRIESTESQDGMSFTEFTYQIFQGYDFYKLRQLYNCQVQLGGSDQWGNIASGCELIRRQSGGSMEGYGATIPLLVDSKGNKLGKSEGNAIWMDPKKTSPYELYQYFLNIADADVEDCLLKITFKGEEDIKEVLKRHAERPEDRHGQKTLAKTVVEMAHGKSALDSVLGSTEAFFTAEQNVKALTLEQFEAQFRNTERIVIQRSDLKDISSLVVQAKLRGTKAEVKRLVQQGGLSVNGEIISSDERIKSGLTEADMLHGKYIVVKVGKKSFALVEVV